MCPIFISYFFFILLYTNHSFFDETETEQIQMCGNSTNVSAANKHLLLCIINIFCISERYCLYIGSHFCQSIFLNQPHPWAIPENFHFFSKAVLYQLCSCNGNGLL